MTFWTGFLRYGNLKGRLVAQNPILALFLLALMAVGCSTPSAPNTSHDSAAPPPRPLPPEVTSKTPDALPAPTTRLSLQTKYTKAIPLDNSRTPAYTIVQQWVFQVDGKDDSLICVGDGEHCIALLKLKEQLTRPANDPLGIR
jgi:hypothetical protein